MFRELFAQRGGEHADVVDHACGMSRSGAWRASRGHPQSTSKMPTAGPWLLCRFNIVERVPAPGGLSLDLDLDQGHSCTYPGGVDPWTNRNSIVFI